MTVKIFQQGEKEKKTHVYFKFWWCKQSSIDNTSKPCLRRQLKSPYVSSTYLAKLRKS